MRDSEKNVGRADRNLAGARSAAEGETQEPEKVIDDGHTESPELGSEGGGGASYHRNSNERKPNA